MILYNYKNNFKCDSSCYTCSGPASTNCLTCIGSSNFVSATTTCDALCPNSQYIASNVCMPVLFFIKIIKLISFQFSVIPLATNVLQLQAHHAPVAMDF